MTYEIFCITLFFSTAVIPLIMTVFLVLVGIDHLAERKRERAEKEAIQRKQKEW